MRPKTRKKTSKTFFILCILLMVGLIALGLLIYLPGSSKKTSLPVYEEIYSAHSDLNTKIQQIDRAIYESLYQEGVAEKDVRFSLVRPTHSGDYDWDFTELSINLENKDSALQLEKKINNELSKLQPGVTIESEKISGGELVCHVFALGLYTHRIRLIQKGYEETERRVLPKIAIIIDDMGYDPALAVSFMEVDLPLDISILPIAPFTDYIVNEANKRGCETLLHLPMEPKGYPRLNPGPGALLTEMDEEEIRARIDDLVKRVPGIKGVNNHMGSCYTERDDKMAIVLEELKKRNLFYVDSRTTAKTVGLKLAREIGVPATKKSVFLDNDLSEKAIKLQMERLLGIARYSGTAVGIGHPHKQTLRVLREYLDQLKRDFEVVPVSELVG